MCLIDYHVHTPLCNHARGEMEAYVKQAIELGLREICFLDHLTLRPDGGALSMSPQEVPLYYQAARKLAKRYETRILVKVGLEVDFDLDTMDHARDIVNSHAFDAIGGSVHFLGHWNMVSHRGRDNCPYSDCQDMFAAYLDHVESMVDHSFFDFLCHLDVVGKFGDRPGDPMEEHWNRVIEKIAAKGLVVEVNTSGLRHPSGVIYPEPWLLQKLHKAGIRIILGSDAHSPEQVGKDFDKALDLVRKVGYERLVTFSKRQRGSISIDPSPLRLASGKA
ncbi:MAG: histidinol-phosphatase [Desulfatibacillum sp.]|nr:histidinol-phosphatase [Desulfatibacillum sp.]